MINLSDVQGKRLAMAAWARKKDGSDDVVVFTGIADWDGKSLRILREGGEVFEVKPEFWERIRPVEEELKEIVLQAEFLFSVTVGDAEGEESLEKTALKWPK